MTRKQLEKITATLVVILATMLAFGGTLIVANLIFEWDLFSPTVEKTLYFIATTSLIFIISAVIINQVLKNHD